jgi:uncharacterized membrane protein YphA (DoxX/SURF4 family)
MIMNIALWIVQAALALAFLMAGAMKVARTKVQVSATMAWAKDFEPVQIKLIGTAEVLGALGLVLPALTNLLPWLTPLAAAALFALMAGAVYTHLRLKELPHAVPSVALGLFSALVAAGRFFVAPL